jgi:hypothetical protein
MNPDRLNLPLLLPGLCLPFGRHSRGLTCAGARPPAPNTHKVLLHLDNLLRA